MKCLLLTLLAALALPTAVNANVDPKVHNLCKDVSDYMGCVKANSKNNSWNPFKSDVKGKKSKNSFQLSKADKEKWCDYKNLNKENKQGLNRCIENLEALGPKFSSLSFESHKKCVSSLKNLPSISSYISCLETAGDKSILLIVKEINSEEIARIDYLQLKRDWGPELVEESGNRSFGTNKYKKPKEVFVHRGKTYTASQGCPNGKNMIWSVSGLFGRKVNELGCMTEEELRLVNIEFEIKKLKLRAASNSFNNAANSINNFKMQQRINANTYSNSGY